MSFGAHALHRSPLAEPAATPASAAPLPELSLVVPLHNEAASLAPFLERARAALARRPERSEIILVDDGSTDDTLARIRAAAAADPRIRGVALRRRFGKGPALAAGVERAVGARIVTIDGDLQEDPAEIDLLLGALDEGFDLACGRRRVRCDSLAKRASSWFFNWLLRRVTGLALHDANCGFKAFSRALAEDLLLSGGRFRYIAVVAHWLGYRVTERDISHRARAQGHSHYGLERAGGALVDLVALLCLTRYHDRPGALFITAGSLSTLGGVAICGHIAWIFVEHGNIQSRHPYLILGVLLLILGVQLVATGFLGEWLAFQGRRGGQHYRVRWDSARASDRPAADAVDP